jgi:hypothetical protein
LINDLRSNLSANTPAQGPMRKTGKVLRANTAPVITVSPLVISSISHPIVRICSQSAEFTHKFPNHRSRKFGNFRDSNARIFIGSTLLILVYGSEQSRVNPQFGQRILHLFSFILNPHISHVKS